jgi:hypothetical protein
MFCFVLFGGQASTYSSDHANTVNGEKLHWAIKDAVFANFDPFYITRIPDS